MSESIQTSMSPGCTVACRYSSGRPSASTVKLLIHRPACSTKSPSRCRHRARKQASCVTDYCPIRRSGMSTQWRVPGPLPVLMLKTSYLPFPRLSARPEAWLRPIRQLPVLSHVPLPNRLVPIRVRSKAAAPRATIPPGTNCKPGLPMFAGMKPSLVIVPYTPSRIPCADGLSPKRSKPSLTEPMRSKALPCASTTSIICS